MPVILFQNMSLADTALTLAEEWGFSVIPLQPKTKRPFVEWADFQKVRPTSEMVEEWWEKHPEANIGIICGPVSNLLVLDCDSKKAQEWAKANVIDTPLCVTTRRGYHLYYKWPHEMSENSLKEARTRLKTLNIGLDLQISGNYVVGPQSIHPSGAVYTMQDLFGDSWLDESVPEFMETTNFKTGVDLSDLHLENVVAEHGEIEEGTRNDLLTKWVGRAVAQGGDFNSVLSAALEENESRFKPPLKPMEVRTIVKSIFKREARKKTELEEKKKTEDPSTDMEGLQFTVNQVKTTPPWPRDLLHPGGLLEQLIDFCVENSPRTNRVYGLAGAYTLLSTILGQRIVSPTGLTTNTYNIVIGRSSTGKDAPKQLVNRILNSPELANSGISNAFGGSSISSDVAILKYLAREKCHRALFVFDEVGQFFKATKSPNSPLAQTIKTLTELYSCYGSAFTKRYACEDDDQIILWQSCSLLGLTVPNEFWNGLTSQEAVNGFLARCMIFESTDLPSRPDYKKEKRPIPKDILDGIKALWGIECEKTNDPLKKGEFGMVYPHVIQYTPDAELLNDEYADLAFQNQVEAEEKGDPIASALYGRSAEKAIKTTLIHAASRLGPKVIESQIEPRDVIWAWKLQNFVDESTIRQMESNMFDSDFQSYIKTTLEIIDQKASEGVQKGTGKPGASKHEIYRALQKIPPRTVDEVLDSLVKSDMIRVLPVWKSPSGSGRPFKNVYCRVAEITQN